MYYLLLFHSLLRWLVLLTLLVVFFRAFRGRFFKTSFLRSDQIWVSAASGFSQLQLLLGFAIYYHSPVAMNFWSNRSFEWSDSLFFAIVHFGLMAAAVVVISVGASLAKREVIDFQKFRLLFQYYSIALLLILVAIPWPFSSLAQRPYFRF